MDIICLDLEGVLIPEIWINVAEKTGISALRRTTRDEPDYDKLMAERIAILKEHNLSLENIQEVIATMEPLPGAVEFLQTLRALSQVVILSDTFTQFAQPMMKKLGWPTIFCNELLVDDTAMITGFSLRQRDGKRKAIEALKSIGFRTFAAGDSYNDLTMIKAADRGALFRAPQNILQEEPELQVATTYEEFLAIIREFLG